MKKTFFIRLLLIFTLLFSFVNFCFAQDNFNLISNEEKINIMVYEKITPSVVAIEAQTPKGLSSGTGCVIDSSGIILTSMHVVYNARNIEVTSSTGKVYQAEVISILRNNNDLALIRINPQENLYAVPLGNSDIVKVGQRVLTIGNPFGFNGTFTTGIVSRIDYQRNKIQTDAAINPGCSGGPLLNTKGEVIGINQSIYNPDNNQSNIGIGFAVPINNAKEFIARTKQKMASAY